MVNKKIGGANCCLPSQAHQPSPQALHSMPGEPENDLTLLTLLTHACAPLQCGFHIHKPYTYTQSYT